MSKQSTVDSYDHLNKVKLTLEEFSKW